MLCVESRGPTGSHADKVPVASFFQSSSNPCSILEAAKHQDIGLPRAFSFCYQQEVESTKQTLGGRNKALPEQVWIKVGGKPQRGAGAALMSFWGGGREGNGEWGGGEEVCKHETVLEVYFHVGDFSSL